MVSRTVITELRAELARLRRQAEVIESCLCELDESAPDAGAVIPKPSESSGAGTADKSSTNGSSFASDVRSALYAIARPAKPREVAGYLVSMGFPKTRNSKPLRDSVSVSLFGMARSTHIPVRKVGTGLYEYVKEDVKDE